MFNYFTTLLFIIKIFHSKQNNDTKSYLSINDKFSYMQYNEDLNEFNIYLGNELIYINFKNSKNIKFNNDSISFPYSEGGENFNLTYNINNTRIYYIHDYNFIFTNKTFETKINFNYNEKKISIIWSNVILEGINIDYNIFFSNNEYTFVEIPIFSQLLVLFGVFIILYGSHHYDLAMIIHVFFFTYFFIGDIISFFTPFDYYIYFLIFACFLFGITVFFLLRNISGSIRKLRAVQLIYGASFGFSVFKTSVYYYIFFNFSVGFVNKNIRIFLYFLFLIIFISIGIVLNWFDIFKKYRYLPCSAISGSLYITKGLEYVIGGYFSSILFIREDLKFINLKDDILYYSLTFFLIQISIIIFSIIFQIKYIKFKEIEDPEVVINVDEAILPTRVSDLSACKDEEESNKKDYSDKISGENDHDDINDQED